MPEDRPRSPTSSAASGIQVSAMDGERLERSLIAAYVTGSPSVRVETDGSRTEAIEQRIEEVARRLEGATYGPAGDQNLRVRFQSSPIRDPFARVGELHTGAQTVLEIAEETIAERLDPSEQNRLVKTEQRCDRILFHLLRHANQDTDWSPTDRQTALASAQRLERIADYAYEIADGAQTLTPQERVGVIADRLNDAIREVQRHVERAHEALQAPDFVLGQETVEAVRQWCQALDEEAVSLAGTPREPGQLPAQRLYRGYFSLLEDTQRIGLYAKSIAEAGVDRATAQLAETREPTITLAPSGE